jgi:hypothetical protein
VYTDTYARPESKALSAKTGKNSAERASLTLRVPINDTKKTRKPMGSQKASRRRRMRTKAVMREDNTMSDFHL